MTNQRPRIDYTNKDFESLTNAMLDIARERLPEWTDHSPNDVGVLLLEANAAVFDALFYYLDRVAKESYLETAQERRSIVNLLRLIGEEPRPPMPAYAELTLLFELPNNPPPGPVLATVAPGATFSTNPKVTGTPINFQYIRPALTIDLQSLEDFAQDGKTYKVYGPLPVVQVDQSMVNDVLGSSDGSPRQRFPLARKPLIDGTLQVWVKQPNLKMWTQRDSLLYSGAQDEHFSVRRDENDVAWVEFGDGARGKPPVRGRNNILVNYAVGGGVKGNVPAMSITEGAPGITYLTKFYNPQPGNRGTDNETIAEAVLRGPRQFRSMGRAVTASDYEAHARAFGVAKARARGFGTRVELLIAPAGGGYPSDQLKDDLRAYLDSKRIVTSVIDIRDPQYVTIQIAITADIEPFYYKTEVGNRIRQAVRNLWSFDRVQFGETLYVSKIYEAIEALEGVAGVSVTTFGVVGGASAVNGVIALQPNQLPYSNGFISATDLVLNGGK